MATKYLTKTKFDELAAELTDLKTNKRKEIARALEYARALGDLSENAEYHQAREEQAMIEDRIMDIENTLKFAEIVKAHHTESIELGSTITVEKTGMKEKQKFIIVGSDEADMSLGKISNNSPLGLALMGKKKGDEAKVKTPKGSTVFKIISIE